MKSSVIFFILFLSLSVNSFSQLTHLGLDSICVNDISIYNDYSNDYLYVGTVDSGVYRFDSADSSWSNLGLRDKWITSIYPEYYSLWAGIDRVKTPEDSTLIYRFSEGDWVADDSGMDRSSVYKINSINGYDGSIYAGGKWSLYKRDTSNWQKIYGYPTRKIEISPGGVIWVCAYSGFEFALIYKSYDEGRTLNNVAFSGEDSLWGNWLIPATSIAFHSKDTNIFYVAIGNAIIKITDGGNSYPNDAIGYRTLVCNHNLSTVVIDPFDNNHLLAGGDHFQLYETTNAGDTWQLITEVDSGNNITDLEIRETNLCKVYISTSKNGVYQLTLPNAGFRMKLSYTSGWTLFSLPLKPRDPYQPKLLPSAISKAFSYEGGYEIQDTLVPGKGYWIKFDKFTTVYFIGEELLSLSIDVLPGWNMIGSISKPVVVAGIQLSSGLTIGTVITYAGSFQTATTINPGLGYWVRADQAGTITLVASP
jgi:hypothetical protein